ncbi:MAG: hypothetical protein JWM11_2767 [Planctomycetaceae bacterium]|nr:hypothetical protein [Planctomycetaceae bacterium]
MASEEHRRRFELALSSEDPDNALYELAATLKSEGMGQVAIFHLFSEFQQNVSYNDQRYDAILDNMDLIWGGPWAKGRSLFKTELTNAEIAELDT